MSYNLKKLRYAVVKDFFEQSNNTDIFSVPVQRFYNGLDLAKMSAYLLMEFADGVKDKFILTSSAYEDCVVVSKSVTRNMQRAAGVAKCQISFEKEGDIALSDIFEIDVKSAIHDKTEDENPYVPSIIAEFSESMGALTQKVDENERKISANADNIAEIEAAYTAADAVLGENISEAEGRLNDKLTEHKNAIDALESAVADLTDRENERFEDIDSSVNALSEKQLADVAQLTSLINAQKTEHASDISQLNRQLEIQAETEKRDTDTLSAALNEQKSKETTDVETLSADIESVAERQTQDKADLQSKISNVEGQFSENTDTITCEHEIEITGKTEHEYPYTIEDGTVLFKRISGKSRRYSENLLDNTKIECDNSEMIQINDDGTITVNGVCEEGFYVRWPLECEKGNYSLFLNNTSAGKGSAIEIRDGADVKVIGNDISVYAYYSNIEIKSLLRYLSYTFVAGTYDNYVFRPMLKEGKFSECEYRKFDNTLVNAKAELLSIGRNLYKGDNQLISVISPDVYTLKNGSNTCKVECYDGEMNLIQTQTVRGKLMAVTSGIKYVKLTLTGTEKMLYYGSDEIAYEPYLEDRVDVGEELGEWDYIENNKLVRQTSEKIVIDGVKVRATQISSGCILTFNYTANEASALEVVGNTLRTAADTVETNLASGGLYILSHKLKYKAQDKLGRTLAEWNQYFKENPETVVYKLAQPIVTDIYLPNGYRIWQGGQQQQIVSEGFLPYKIEKEYGVSLKSKVDVNMKIDVGRQAQLDGLAKRLSELEARIAAMEKTDG